MKNLTIKNQNQPRLGSLNKLILASMLLVITSSIYAAGSFQHNALFTPSNSLLLAESKGRIMIYDGLKSETVEVAMNEQFNRIENMMFVRTLVEQEDGDYVVEEDGCD